MLFAETEAVGLHLFDQVLAGDFYLHGWAEGEFFFVKVDHDDLAAGLEHLLH